MPAKLMGLAFLAAAWLIRREIRRAHERGHVGRRNRPIRRTEQRWRFRGLIALRVAGLLICLVAAYLCLTGPRGEF